MRLKELLLNPCFDHEKTMKCSRSGSPTNNTGLEQMLMKTLGDQKKLLHMKCSGWVCRQKNFYY